MRDHRATTSVPPSTTWYAGCAAASCTLVVHDPAMVQESVFGVDSAFLRGMRTPAPTSCRWAATMRAPCTGGRCGDGPQGVLRLESELGEEVTFGDGRLAIPIEDWPLGVSCPTPLGVAYFDADSLAYLGRADLPKVRAQVKQTRAWGVDLVAVETASPAPVPVSGTRTALVNGDPTRVRR